MNVLNVTAVLDTSTPARWVISTLEKLHQHPHIQLNHIILQSASADSPPCNIQQTPLHKAARKLLHGYIDRPRFGRNNFDAQPLPTELHTLIQSTGDTTGDQSFEKHPPTCDVILHLGDLDNEQTTLPQATHGIWIVKHQTLADRIEEAVLTRCPLLWVHLWNIENQTGAIKRIGSHSLPMQSFSITDVLNYGFSSLPGFIESRLNWLANGFDPAQFERDQITPEFYPQYAFPDEYQPPQMSGLTACLRTLALLGLQTQQRVRDKLQTEQWQLGYLPHNHHATDIELSEYRELTPPASTIWADPHLIIENDQTHVFFEELEVTENLGRIAWAVLTPEGFENPPKTVLAEEHHLSYPFIFKHQDDIYMLPETASQRTISLYKATHFPDQWERIGNIMEDVDAADSTLIERDGLWWLFTNGISHVSVDERDQLSLFYTDDVLSGDWHPHPLNPIVTGIDRARMAGPIYHKDGDWFRPSQYGATRYGFGINVSKIHKLTKTDYQETLIKRLTPNASDAWLGCHTALHSDQITVIDRLRRVKR